MRDQREVALPAIQHEWRNEHRCGTRSSQKGDGLTVGRANNKVNCRGHFHAALENWKKRKRKTENRNEKTLCDCFTGNPWLFLGWKWEDARKSMLHEVKRSVSCWRKCSRTILIISYSCSVLKFCIMGKRRSKLSADAVHTTGVNDIPKEVGRRRT